MQTQRGWGEREGEREREPKTTQRSLSYSLGLEIGAGGIELRVGELLSNIHGWIIGPSLQNRVENSESVCKSHFSLHSTQLHPWKAPLGSSCKSDLLSCGLYVYWQGQALHSFLAGWPHLVGTARWLNSAKLKQNWPKSYVHCLQMCNKVVH